MCLCLYSVSVLNDGRRPAVSSVEIQRFDETLTVIFAVLKPGNVKASAFDEVNEV
jgi:hypothetical protein